MKKSLFALLALTTQLMAAEDFVITKTVRSARVSVSNLQVSPIEQHVSPNGPLGSEISLLIEGDYDGGWCWVKDLALKISRKSGSQFDAKETNELEIVALDDFQENKAVPLTSQACAGGSSGKFKMPVKVTIGAWGRKTVTSHTWSYLMNTGDGKTTQLDVVFDTKQGWSHQVLTP